MKKFYTSLILVLTLLISTMAIAQETQKNFINYQGLARNAERQVLANASITIGIGLRFGAANAAIAYEENHNIGTDVNGVFSLLIGNGSAVNGNYNTLPWGTAAIFVTVIMNGNEIGATEMMAVPYAISSGDADDQSANEVPYDNLVSGLTASSTQEAIDELAGGGTINTDNQGLLLTGDMLSIQDGTGTVDLSAYIEDADADPNNEIQTLSFDASTNELSLSDGGTVTIPSGGTDADADPTNEFQTLSFDAGTNELSLSDGNSITIPSSGTDGDSDPENEIDITRRHGILIGDDGLVDGLVGTVDGQVAKWDAALGNWVAGTDETGGGGVSSPWSQSGGNVYLIDGNVGIGVNNPDEKLVVDGFITSRDLSGPGLRNVLADENGRLVEGVIDSGSSPWEENGDDVYIVDKNIGIGTENPIALQHIHSSSTAISNLHFTNGASGRLAADGLQIGLVNDLGIGLAGFITNEESGPLAFGTNSTHRMIISSDGNVGINALFPSYRLDVDGDIRSTDLSGTGQRNVMADADGKLIISAGGGGSSVWETDATGINYTSGNVGIGASSSIYPLNIDTNNSRPINLTSSTADNYMAFNNTAGYVGYAGIFNGDSDMDFGTGFLNGTGKVHLVTNAQPKLTVAADGDVGIGTTSPTEKLDVQGNISLSGEVYKESTGSTDMLPIAYGFINDDGTIRSGSGNFTVVQLGTGLYQITIPEENDQANWTILTTINHTAPGIASVGHSGSAARNFGVNTWRLNSTRADFSFSFVVYKR